VVLLYGLSSSSSSRFTYVTIKYDWRYADNPPGYYAALKSLIEEMYNSNDRKAVHIVAHSMANMHTGVFLSKQPQQWKDQYIASFISVAGPWSGAPMALRTLVSTQSISFVPL